MNNPEKRIFQSVVVSDLEAGDMTVDNIVVDGIQVNQISDTSGNLLLNQTTLGPNVVNSSLTNVGTLTSLSATTIDCPEYKADGDVVLTNNTLGSTVTASSLTSLGTISDLSVSNNIFLAPGANPYCRMFNFGGALLQQIGPAIGQGGDWAICNINRTPATSLPHSLVFKADGKLGVGVVLPNEVLDVEGNANVSGSYKVSGVDTLTNDTLGSAVVNSSLTSVGTLDGLFAQGHIDFAGQRDLSATQRSTVTLNQGTNTRFQLSMYDPLDIPDTRTIEMITDQTQAVITLYNEASQYKLFGTNANELTLMSATAGDIILQTGAVNHLVLNAAAATFNSDVITTGVQNSSNQYIAGKNSITELEITTADSITQNVVTDVAWDTTYLGRNPATYVGAVITFPMVGYYQVSAHCEFEANSNGAREIIIVVSGLESVGCTCRAVNDSIATKCAVENTFNITNTTTQTLKMQVWQGSSGALDLNSAAIHIVRVCDSV